MATRLKNKSWLLKPDPGRKRRDVRSNSRDFRFWAELYRKGFYCSDDCHLRIKKRGNLPQYPEGKLSSEVDKMKRAPEMEQFMKEEIQGEVLEDLEAEFKAQGSWVQPGSA